MTNQDIITDILEREGGATNDPLDGGGRTQFGISEASNPTAWRDGKVTEAEARLIYETKYLKATHIDKVVYGSLREQLLDFAVNSGPVVAIRELQRILGVEDDGVLGPITLGLVNKANPHILGNALVAARVKMICRVVQRNPSQVRYLGGWCSRALTFLS